MPDNLKPLWPFVLNSGAEGAVPLWPDKYYAFYDCGGVAHAPGWDSVGLAWRCLSITHRDTEQVYNSPAQIGHACLTVCTGEQFVDAMRSRGILEDMGQWGGLQ